MAAGSATFVPMISFVAVRERLENTSVVNEKSGPTYVTPNRHDDVDISCPNNGVHTGNNVGDEQPKGNSDGRHGPSSPMPGKRSEN